MTKKRFTIFAAILLLFVTCISILGVSQPINSTYTTQLSEKQDYNLKINQVIENFSGPCTANISNLYVYENATILAYVDTNNYSKSYRANVSLDNLDFGNLTAAKLSLTITALTEPFNYYYIANDTENATFGPAQDQAKKLAQEFTLDDTEHVDYFFLYLNYTNWGGILVAGIVYLNIYKNIDDNITKSLNNTPINENDLLIWLPDTANAWNASWFSVRFNGLLANGSYYAVIYTQSTSILIAPNNNSWLVNATNEDKGQSLTLNSSKLWEPISGDGNADFLLGWNSSVYSNPKTVNLSCYVNNTKLNLTHYFEDNPAFLRFPWTTLAEYYFPTIPTSDINLTITTDKTLGFGIIFDTIRYIKFIDAFGNFSASLNNRNWLINYTSINSTNAVFPVYVYPDDWTVNKFYNRVGQEIIEYGIMYSKIYGTLYHGLYYPETGDGETTYNYSAEFSSHNYVGKINPQIESDGNFVTKTNFYKGQTIRLEALIQDSQSRPASGGNCTFYLYDPDNTPIYNESVIPAAGKAHTDNLSTKDYVDGDYTVIVTWTNGSQVGFSSITFSILNRPVPFLPPQPETPILLYILITVGVVLACVFGSLIAIRKLQERNWEKSLLHLYIMAKDGRSMYTYPFGLEAMDPTLISGMLTAISSFVKETVKSKKLLKTIDQEDKKVILGHGTFSTVALLAEKDLPIIHSHTKNFLKAFEKQYSIRIHKWDGETTAFKDVDSLVEKYFPTTMESKIIQGVGRQLTEIKELIVSATDPQEILSLLQRTTELAERYHNVIRDHFTKRYAEIIKIINEKIQTKT